MTNLIEITPENIEKAIEPYQELMKRGLLDKYIFDPKMRERKFSDFLSGKSELSTTPNEEGIKSVSLEEYKSYIGKFIDDNKEEMEVDFFERSTEKIPKEKISKYFSILTNEWLQGRKYKDSENILSLHSSIHNFFQRNGVVDPAIFIKKNMKNFPAPLFNTEEVLHLLSINKALIELYFENMVSQLFSMDAGIDLTSSDIWLHRGLHLKTEFSDKDLYLENRYLTSYTTSVSIMEQFAQIEKNKKVALMSIKLYDSIDRVFAFSGFIPKMPTNQQELILIPSTREIIINKEYEHKNLYEYILTCSGISLDKDELEKWKIFYEKNES